MVASPTRRLALVALPLVAALALSGCVRLGGGKPPATLFTGAVADGSDVVAVGYPGNVDQAQGLDPSDLMSPTAPVKTRGAVSAGLFRFSEVDISPDPSVPFPGKPPGSAQNEDKKERLNHIFSNFGLKIQRRKRTFAIELFPHEKMPALAAGRNQAL